MSEQPSAQAMPPEALPPPVAGEESAASPGENNAEASIDRARLAAMEKCRQVAEEFVEKEIVTWTTTGYPKAFARFEARQKRQRKLRPVGYFLFFFVWSVISIQMIVHDFGANLGIILTDLLVGFSAAATILVYMMVAFGPVPIPPSPAQRRARQTDEVREVYGHLLRQQGLI